VSEPAHGFIREASRAAAVLFILLLVAGTALRLSRLSDRPLHGDEAVGAHLSAEVAHTGSFHYESSNRHGPFQYYLSGLVMRWGGDSFFWIRFPYALLGCLLPLVLLGFRRSLSEAGWLLGCSLIVFSPLFVYYSRYAVQEIDFTVATALMLACGLIFARGGGGASLFGFLLAAAWMVTIKETFVIVWGCLAGALALALLAGGRRARGSVREAARRVVRHGLTAMLGLSSGALFVSAAYTDLFRDASGLGNLFRNLASMLVYGASTADAVSLHRHPPSFYTSILLRYEWLTLALALVGMVLAVRTRRTLALLLTFDALLTSAIHFALPYKTPWLLLTPLLPLALLAGLGGGWILARLHASFPPGAAVAAACLIPLGMLPQTLDASFLRPADPSLGLAYHHAGAEQIELAGEIRRILAGLPEGTYPQAVVALPYYWPLAWYLRDETAVLFEPSPIPAEPMEVLQSIPVIVTLESADEKFLASFVRTAPLPSFAPAGHTGRSVVLVPPRYMVGRLWIRNDLIPASSPP
jgi:uncharacterized protein (TIGR03663 family)